MHSICHSVAGPYVGNVLSFPLSAVLCQYGFDGGWPSVFYVFGKPLLFYFLLFYINNVYTCFPSAFFHCALNF